MSDYHVPVLLHASVDGLAIKEDGVYVDLTFGGGGHSKEILNRLGPKGRLIAFDQDVDAWKNAPDDRRFSLVRGNFRYLRNYLRYLEVIPVDGVLADLGVSGHHFDAFGRGFSFRGDAPLDMRMNPSGKLTASMVLNDYSEDRLVNILKEYGEVKNARKVVSAIVSVRTKGAMQTTGDLVRIVEPHKGRLQEKKFLAMVFQAIRIEVNQEVAALNEMLRDLPKVLGSGARASVISYHSLEDRLVKRCFRGDDTDERDPVTGARSSVFKEVGKKPIVPEENETEANPRARSAKLRIAEKQ